MRDLVPGSEPLRSQHDPVWTLTQTERAGRLAFGSLVDAPTFYSRLFTHATRSGGQYLVNLCAYGRGSIEFRRVVYGMTHPREVEIPDEVGVLIRPRDGAKHAFRTSGVGLATWMAWYMYAARNVWDGTAPDLCWGVDAIMDGHMLYEGMGRLLGREITPEERPPLNTRLTHKPSPHIPPGEYPEWWDDEMLGWVAEADAMFVEDFGLHPFVGSGQAIHSTRRWVE